MDSTELKLALRALQRMQEKYIHLRAAIIAEGFAATGDPRYRISRQEVESAANQFESAVRNNAPNADTMLARLKYPDIDSEDIALPATLDKESRGALGEVDRGIVYREQQIELVRQLIHLSELASEGPSTHAGGMDSASGQSS